MNSEDDIRNNNEPIKLKKDKVALDISHRNLKDNGNHILGKNSAENGQAEMEDSSTGAARLKITPLKGISSSLKPRIFKSIGIQVESEK